MKRFSCRPSKLGKIFSPKGRQSKLEKIASLIDLQSRAFTKSVLLYQNSSQALQANFFSSQNLKNFKKSIQINYLCLSEICLMLGELGLQMVGDVLEELFKNFEKQVGGFLRVMAWWAEEKQGGRKNQDEKEKQNKNLFDLDDINSDSIKILRHAIAKYEKKTDPDRYCELEKARFTLEQERMELENIILEYEKAGIEISKTLKRKKIINQINPSGSTQFLQSFLRDNKNLSCNFTSYLNENYQNEILVDYDDFDAERIKDGVLERVDSEHRKVLRKFINKQRNNIKVFKEKETQTLNDEENALDPYSNNISLHASPLKRQVLNLLTDKKDLQVKCDYWCKKNEEANEKIIELENKNQEGLEELRIYQENLNERNSKLLRKQNKIKSLKEENLQLKTKLEKLMNESNDSSRFNNLKDLNYEKLLSSKEKEILINLEKNKLEKKHLLQEIEEINKEKNELSKEIKKLNHFIEMSNTSYTVEGKKDLDNNRKNISLQESQNLKENTKVLTQNIYPKSASHSNEILALLSKLNDSFPKNQELATLFSDLKILLEHLNFGPENKENIENYKINQPNSQKMPILNLEANNSTLIKKFLKKSPSLPKTNLHIVHSNSFRSLESSQSPRLISKKLANLVAIDITTDLHALTIDSANNLESVESLPMTSRSEELQEFRVSDSNSINSKNPKKSSKQSNFRKNKLNGNRMSSGNNSIFSSCYEGGRSIQENDKNGKRNQFINSEYHENSNTTISNAIKTNENLKNLKTDPYSPEREMTQHRVEDRNFSKFKYLYKYPFRKVKVGDTLASLKFYKKIFHKINGEHHKCSSDCEYLKRCYKNKDLRSSCSPKEELQQNKVVIDKLPLIFE